MRHLLLINLMFILSSCPTTNKTNKSSNDLKVRYDESVEYETLVYTQYNSDNLTIEDKVYSPYSRGIYLDTIVSTTNYFYDNNQNLLEKLVIVEAFQDTTKIIYSYDIHDQLISEVKIENNSDTVLIRKKEYLKEDEFIIVKSIQLQKEPFTREKSTIPFDTTFTISKERYSDSLITTRINYLISNGNIEIEDSIIYTYNDKGNLIKTFTIDKNGDTISWNDIEYQGEIKIRDDFYIHKGNYLISQIYDSLGHLHIIINIDFATNDRDTSFHKCDEKGNVVFSKWK